MLDFVYEQLAARIERVRETSRSTCMKPDEEGIHQLRVSIRRLTEAVRSLDKWVKPKAAAKLRGRLRPVMKAAGETRNLDIAMELCHDSAIPIATQVAHELGTLRVEAAHRLIERLLALDTAKLLPPCEPNPERPAARTMAAELIPSLVSPYWEAGDDAAKPGAAWDDLHKFRLATKHLRYTVELFASLYGPAAQTKLDVLKRVQTHLGRVNDCHTARGLEQVSGCAELDDWIAALQSNERDKFLKVWARERDRSKGGAGWVRYFSRAR